MCRTSCQICLDDAASAAAAKGLLPIPAERITGHALSTANGRSVYPSISHFGAVASDALTPRLASSTVTPRLGGTSGSGTPRDVLSLSARGWGDTCRLSYQVQKHTNKEINLAQTGATTGLRAW